MYHKILEIQQDWFGKFVHYQSVEGEYYFVIVSQLHEYKYLPDQLRALHNQIICANSDMIELKEGVGKSFSED